MNAVCSQSILKNLLEPNRYARGEVVNFYSRAHNLERNSKTDKAEFMEDASASKISILNYVQRKKVTTSAFPSSASAETLNKFCARMEAQPQLLRDDLHCGKVLPDLGNAAPIAGVSEKHK